MVSCVQENLEVETDFRNEIMHETSNSCGNVFSDSLKADVSNYIIEPLTRVAFSDDFCQFSWDVDDMIGIYYGSGSSCASASYHITKSMGATATFENSAFKLIGNSTYFAFYPYNPYYTQNSAIINFAGQEQLGNGSVCHLGKYNYMYSDVHTNDVGGADIKFQNIGSVIRIKIKAPQSAVYKSLRITALKHQFMVEGNFNMETGELVPVEESSHLELSFGSGFYLQQGEELIANMLVAPIDLSDDYLSFQLETDLGNYAYTSVPGKKIESGMGYLFSLDGLRTNINVLCIGNSFSVDAFDYLPPLLKNAGFTYNIGVLYQSSCSLEKHFNNINKLASGYLYYKDDGDGWNTFKNKDFQSVLTDCDWDIICFHEVSETSGVLDAITPYLGSLIDIAKRVHPNVQIAYMMTPAWGEYNIGYGVSYKDQNDMYKAICSVGKYVKDNYEINFLIPNATAIQNARQTDLKKIGKDLFASETDRHLEDGIGRLIASYSVYNTLVGEQYGLSFDLNCFLPIYEENVDNKSFPQTSPFADVTAEIAKLGKTCADEATVNKFSINLSDKN